MPINYLNRDIGVDLGTTNTRIFCKGKGVVLNEASSVAIRKIESDEYEIISIGDEANKMLGRTSDNVCVIKPIKDGTIANIEMAEIMLKHFIKKAIKSNFKIGFKPKAIISIPFGVSGIERKAIKRAAKSAGIRDTVLIEEPLAAAIGSGLDIKEPVGNMIVDIGGGTAEAAIISLGEIVCCKSVNIGGDILNKTIKKHIKNDYDMIIGDSTAEHIKITLCTALSNNSNQQISIQGLDLSSGLPKTIYFTTDELFVTLRQPFEVIIEAIKETLLNAPPDLVSDVIKNGIYLTGGTALLEGLDKFISLETNIPIHVAENPDECVVNGIAAEMEHMNKIKKIYDNDFM